MEWTVRLATVTYNGKLDGAAWRQGKGETENSSHGAQRCCHISNPSIAPSDASRTIHRAGQPGAGNKPEENA